MVAVKVRQGRLDAVEEGEEDAEEEAEEEGGTRLT